MKTVTDTCGATGGSLYRYKNVYCSGGRSNFIVASNIEQTHFTSVFLSAIRSCPPR